MNLGGAVWSQGTSNFSETNAKVLEGLKCKNGGLCVTDYTDDILIFSRILDEHDKHLRLVLN